MKFATILTVLIQKQDWADKNRMKIRIIICRMIPVFSLHLSGRSIIKPYTVATYFDLSTATQGTAIVCV